MATSTSKAERLKRKKRKKRRRIALLTVEAIVLLLVIVCVSIYLMPNSKSFIVKTFTKCPAGQSLLKSLYKDDYDKNVLDTTTDKDKIKTVDLGDGYTNIALFGIDPRDGEFENGTHTDTIMIVSINNKTHDVNLVSVYRDSLLRMTTSDGDIDYEKANAAFFRNGVEGALNMLNNNFDLDITEYALVNFQGLAKIIDALGGVDITITDEEAFYISGYLTETRKITGMDAPDVEESGNVHLSGLQATAYCRIRYSPFTAADGTVYHNDYGRTARQRLILTKILEKAQSAGVNQLLKVADTIIKENDINGSKILSTNIPWSRIVDLLTVAVDCKLKDTIGFPYDTYTPERGEAYYGYVVPMGLEQNVIRLHQFLFPDKSYTPSSMVTKINDYLIDETGVYPPTNNSDDNSSSDDSDDSDYSDD
ncbi:MAG: LCP family protein [Clostridiales bacterium]|nr:LCP family protein [Clostridiales bacterium]MDD6293257.1 LCP family protein [Eubacteriales bacterium]